MDGDISTTEANEKERIDESNKKFLYARDVHSNHMIQHHMHQILSIKEWSMNTDPWLMRKEK